VALQENAKDLLAKPSHPVFDLVSRAWLERAVKTGTPQVTQASRHGLERVLDLALWMDLYSPTMAIA
jgi:asparagine synthase (glutamine-hydrolysing)